jgi:hypothetical protein
MEAMCEHRSMMRHPKFEALSPISFLCPPFPSSYLDLAKQALSFLLSADAKQE